MKQSADVRANRSLEQCIDIWLHSLSEPTTCLLVASTSVLFSSGAGRAIRLETRPGRTIRIQDREASSVSLQFYYFDRTFWVEIFDARENIWKNIDKVLIAVKVGN
ncbi:hypothetical protein V1477_009820 [Vespula maculifrons]|uniref:Uncharacterized protein n=1 Tax=Vespula maculifrons TaxID=7453 RepID=A0ABD2CAV4_VESMC